jgi:hypothetical protein
MSVSYQTRLDDLNKAFTLELEGKVLVAPFSDHFFSTRIAGISNKDAMRDHLKRFQAIKKTVLDFDLDLAMQSGIYPSQWFSALDAKHYQWPGGDLPDDKTFQYIEKENLLADEYDQFLADPTDFTIRVLWPRMTGKLEPMAEFPPIFSLGPDPIFLGPAFSYPENLEVLRSLIKLGEAAAESEQAGAEYVAEMTELGYPVSYQANFTPPFDIVADFLRGLKGTMLDLYRVPDKLMAAVDIYVEPQIQAAIAWAEAVDNPRIVFWLHKGAAGFMSDEHYKKYYWPSTRKVILSLVEAGLTPILHVQGDYTPRLEYLAELPRGKVPIHYDRVDHQKALEIMGDRQCFWGGISSALLVTGTPEQVRAEVKKLIDKFGSMGGLIVDGSVGLPDEAKPENIQALVETVRDFNTG